MCHLLKKYGQPAYLTLLILLFSFLASRSLLLSHNTLYENGSWIVTKARLKMAVVGPYGFLSSRNSLAGQHLDLSKWHGFQEVIYKDALDIREISFDFVLSKDSYLVFIFNKNADKFSGIRISTNNLFKNLYFISEDSGEFINKQNLEVANLRSNSWQHFKIIFGRNNFTLYVDKILIGTFNITLLPNQLFGFRGGKNKVLIDNVAIHLRNSKQVISETFDKIDAKLFFLFCIVIVAVNIIAVFLCRTIFKDDLRQGIVRLTGFNASAIAVFLLFFTFDYFYLAWEYPGWENKIKFTMPEGLKKSTADYWKNAGKEFILSSVRDKYAKEPDKNIYRIVFLGASQTWGAGASAKSETSVRRIESKLNELSYGKAKYECINASVSGFDLNDSIAFYLKELPKLDPKIVVFILPNRFDSSFSSNLNKLIKFNNSLNIKTIFLLEARSIEYNFDQLTSACILREFLEKNGIKAMDLNEYLLKNYDRGFLWWDSSHLTSFGQKLVAIYTYEIICKEIGLSH